MKRCKSVLVAAVAAAGVALQSLAVVIGSVEPSDDYLYVYAGDVELSVGEPLDSEWTNYFGVESGSGFTVSASGLPAGVKFDAKRMAFSGAPSKAGRYYVTFKAKNGNKFQHSMTGVWTVGSPAETDYDDIALYDGWLDWLDDLRTGRPINDGAGSICLGGDIKSVSGLPAGLKFKAGSLCDSSGLCTACSGFIVGIPTKAGKYTVKMTDRYNRKAEKTVIVRDSGYICVSVDAPYANECGMGPSGGWCVSTGTVSGGGVLAIGSKASLKATPKKGYVFAGWYEDDEFEFPVRGLESGDWRKPSDSLVLREDLLWGENIRIYGRFEPKCSDFAPEIYCEGVWNVSTGGWNEDFPIEVDSLSMPTVTVKGLPSGIKYQNGALVVTDSRKLAPGTKDVVITAKNASGATSTRTVSVVVPNLQSDVFSDIDYDGEYVRTVGENDSCIDPSWISFTPGTKVSVSGLPPGLKATVDSEEGWVYLHGTPTKAGVYTVTLTAKIGSLTEKATVTLRVNPFPPSAVGTYVGCLVSSWDSTPGESLLRYGISDVQGSLTATVAANGKITAKFTYKGKTTSLSGTSCEVTDSVICVYLYDAKGRSVDLVIYPDREIGQYQLEGFVEDPAVGDSWEIIGQRNDFKTEPELKDMALTLSRFGKIPAVVMNDGSLECPNCVAYSPWSEKVMFTVGRDGVVKAAGTIDGVSVSASAPLMVEKIIDKEKENLYFYADFTVYNSSYGRFLAFRVVFDRDWTYEAVQNGYGADSMVLDGEYSFSYQ